MDNLLHSNGILLVGANAVSSVAVEHEGWALYPLGDEKQQDEGQAKLQTAAAFVPLHMMPAESSSSSSSESESEEDAHAA